MFKNDSYRKVNERLLYNQLMTAKEGILLLLLRLSRAVIKGQGPGAGDFPLVF